MSSPVNKTNQNGFSLVEMIVTVSILALISAIFLANYHGGERQANFALSVQQAASDIRLAQNNTMGLTEISGSFPNGGWGVFFEVASSSYIIFADSDPPLPNPPDHDYTAADTFYRTVDLPEGVEVNDITDTGGSQTDVAITFVPPDPETWINGAPNGSTTIEFINTQNGATSTIFVNFLGLIDIF